MKVCNFFCYSGDHDMSVTLLGTQNWISLLNLTLYEIWRTWYVDGQVAGYVFNSVISYLFFIFHPSEL